MSSPDKQLSPHFRLSEFAQSGERPDLVVPVPADLVPSMQRLAVEVLEPIRKALVKPMKILSGYRSRELNKAIGGSVTSQHVRGEACDFTTIDIRGSWLSILQLVSDDQLKDAGQMIYYPTRGFIHVALASGRFPHATCCIHWPESNLRYAPIAPTLAAFNAAVPANLDPQRGVRLA